MAMTDGSEGKKQSMYTPSPHRDTKRSKSEEVELEQPNFSSMGEATQIRDLLNDINDLSDDLSQQQSQVRCLSHKQRRNSARSAPPRSQ